MSVTLPVFSTSGDHSGGVTPDPIPNSVVKPSSADGTTRVTVWESRTLPELISKVPGAIAWDFLLSSTQHDDEPT